MVSKSLVEITLALDDTSLDDQERQKFTIRLLKQLREQGDAESVERTEDLSPEVGSKGGVDKLVGALTATVPLDKFVSFMGFVGGKVADKFADKPIKIHVKDDGFEVIIQTTGEKAAAIAGKIASDLLDKRKNGV